MKILILLKSILFFIILISFVESQERDHICTVPDFEKTPEGIFSSAVISQKWDPGDTLTVKFLPDPDSGNPPDPEIVSKVKKYAKLWEEHGNIKFNFVSSGDAHIRITFTYNGMSYSKGIGKMILRVDQSQHNMNFGWFDAYTSEEEIKRVTLHEFGHALGLHHEHQNPGGRIEWDKDAIYAWGQGQNPPWSKAAVDHNIINKLDKDLVNHTKFDPDSIMIYPFPKSWTKNGFSAKENRDLSEMDKIFFGKTYPFPSSKNPENEMLKLEQKMALLENLIEKLSRQQQNQFFYEKHHIELNTHNQSSLSNNAIGVTTAPNGERIAERDFDIKTFDGNKIPEDYEIMACWYEPYETLHLGAHTSSLSSLLSYWSQIYVTVNNDKTKVKFAAVVKTEAPITNELLKLRIHFIFRKK